MRLKQFEPFTSPWASSVFLVHKQNGTIYFYVDYRRLNVITRFVAYSLQHIDKTLEFLGKAKFFSTLDLISDYRPIGQTEQKKLSTAPNQAYIYGISRHSAYEMFSNFRATYWNYTPGLQMARLPYLPEWHHILLPGRRKNIDSFRHVTKVLTQKWSYANVTFLHNRLTTCNTWCLKMALRSIFGTFKAFVERPTPRTQWRTSFFGIARYYRKLFNDFISIAAPLGQLINKGAQWEW